MLRSRQDKNKRPHNLPQRRAVEEEILAVLTEEESGRVYYVSLIDVFEFEGREYSVMYNYRLGVGRNLEPEIVIMRSYREKDEPRIFSSIRNPRELELVFELFYERFLQVSKQGGGSRGF